MVMKKKHHKIDCASPVCNRKGIIVPKNMITCGGSCSRTYKDHISKIWHKKKRDCDLKILDNEIKLKLKKKMLKINPKIKITLSMVMAYKIGLSEGKRNG